MKQMIFNNQDRLMGIAAKALVLLGGALVALSLALAMSGCTDSFRENDYPRPWGNSEGDDDDLVPVEFTLSSQRNHDFTRAESSIVSFNSGETIKVFVSTDGGSSYTDYDYTTAAAGQEVGLTAPAPPPYFPNGSASTVQAYAYYPATAGASATFSVADNQTSDAAYKSSDLMYAANRTITKGSSEGTKLQMAHKMVQLCITASAASGSDLSIYKVKVNAKKSVTFTPADGTATATGDNGDVIALTQAGTGYVLIPPQLINNVTIKIETDEVGSAQGTATFGFASTSSFEAGNSYSLDLTVSPTQLGTTTAITDWNGAGSVVIGATGNLTICDLDNQTYTGTALTPSFTVKKNGVTLVKDDANGYTAQYLNNTNAGTAYVLALGQGTNDGSVGVASFKIEKAAALFSYGESDTENKTYGDAAFTKALTNTGDGTITYTSSVESVATVDAAGQVTIVGAGTTVITASAVDGNNYTYPTNSAHYTLNVAKKAIASSDIVLAEESMVYTGSALTRHVASVAGLTDASNWTVTGNTQTNVGNYELTVTMAEACANYTGSAAKGWNIAKVSSSMSYTGGNVSFTSLQGNTSSIGCTISCTNCSVSGASVASGSGFSVSVSSNTVTITRTSTSAFSGTVTVSGTPINGNYNAPTNITISVSAAVYDSRLVDLGLSVYWASMNVGASSETDYGNFYCWGGTTDVTSTSINLGWNETCPYWSSGSESSAKFTKYVPTAKTSNWAGSGSPDNKLTLDSSDDAARQHANWGGNWRMPTKAEFDELLSGTDNEWATISGVNGRKFMKKSDHNVYIFLPAASHRSGTGLSGQGSYGFYWSSSLDSDSPCYAWDLNFYSSKVYVRNLYNRYYGYSVRAVQSK